MIMDLINFLKTKLPIALDDSGGIKVSIVAGGFALAYRGTYAGGTTYNFNDLVTTDAGTSYISLVNGNVGNAPASSPSQWAVFAAHGSHWLVNNGEPGSGDGVDGDTCLDVASGAVYLKSSGSWNLQGNIKGPTGATGEQGIQGEQGNQGVQGEPGGTGPAGPDSYTPANAGHWDTTPPSTFTQAVDRLAKAVSVNGVSPIPQ